MTVARVNFVTWLAFDLGVPYDNGGDRLNPPANHPTDCSGFIWRGLHFGAGVPMPPVVSSALARWCYDHGGEISVAEARSIPGALLFMGPDRGLRGFGNAGHVAAVAPKPGWTLETPTYPGHKSGNGHFDGRHWTGAGLPPIDGFRALNGAIIPWGDLTPTPPAPPPVHPLPPPVSPKLGQVLRGLAADAIRTGPMLTLHMRGQSVKAWQHAANLALDTNIVEDGDFGPQTLALTKYVQIRTGVIRDGIVGPATRAACVHLLETHR